MPSTLDAVSHGQSVFVDANIFIYHFTGQSLACRSLLEHCEAGEVQGMTGAHVVMEVLHRVMMLEAVQRGLVTPGNIARRLREHPQVVQRLNDYTRHASRIPAMGVEVLPVDLELVQASQAIRTQSGLLVSDSVTVAMLEHYGISAIASQDQDFLRVAGLQVYLADDI